MTVTILCDYVSLLQEYEHHILQEYEHHIRVFVNNGRWIRVISPLEENILTNWCFQNFGTQHQDNMPRWDKLRQGESFCFINISDAMLFKMYWDGNTL